MLACDLPFASGENTLLAQFEVATGLVPAGGLMATPRQPFASEDQVAFHPTQPEPGAVARTIIDPQILAEWSILWPARTQSAAIERFRYSARLCATNNDSLTPPGVTTTAEHDPLNPTPL